MEKESNQEKETNQEKQCTRVSPSCTCCQHKTKKRDEKEYKDLYNRLNRIEGQVRGVKRMLEEDYYCVDILTQVSAISAALKGFNCQLLESHINTCVADNLKNGNQEVVSELVDVMKKMMK